MNNSDLSLGFLKKCRENGVPNDMAILAALQDLADWKDQHPRKGLWDSKKIIKFIKENVREYHKSGVFHLDDFINDLRKAMEN